MIAVSRRCVKLRPAQACSSRASSAPVNTGTSLSVTRGGCRPAIGSGSRSSAASHLKNCCRARYWFAGVGGAVAGQQPCHPLLDVLAADLLPAGQAGQASGGEPLHRLGVGPDCLGGLALGGQAQGERADLGLEYPGVQLFGLPGTRSRCGHGHSSPRGVPPVPGVTGGKSASLSRTEPSRGRPRSAIGAQALRADMPARGQPPYAAATLADRVLRTIRTGFLADRLWLMRVPGFRPPAGCLPHMPMRVSCADA